MADITKCSGDGCPVRSNCKRFTAKPNEYWQPYFIEVPFEDNKCEMFWGENAEYIFGLLKEITSGKKK